MRKFFFALLVSLASFAVPALADSFSGYSVTEEGAWCWFADPRAIHVEKPGVKMSYLGYIDVHGNIKATQMDWITGKRDEVLVRSYFQPDDHDNPTFLVLPDERVLVIYSRHTDEAAFYYRVSQKPYDITTLGQEHRLATANNTTYPSPFLMSDDPDHFYLCWRGIGWHPTIARLTLPDASDNVQFDWGPYQIVQSTGARPYAKYYSNGKDKIYLTYTTGHPDNEQPNWVYFNVININGGNKPTLNDIKGNQLSVIENGKFNVNKNDSYKQSYPNTIVDAPSNYRDWVWQTILDTDGNPVIAMVRITGGKDQHEYFYAKWTGSQWRLTDLADGGGRFHSSNTEYCYSGGMALDASSPKDIYLSIPTEGDYGKVYEIWKYTLNDNGGVANREQITKNSQKNNVRPYVLPGSENSAMKVGWMNGDYYYWIVSKNYPKGYPTGIRCDYQWVENIETSAPDRLQNNTYAFDGASQFTVSADFSLAGEYKGVFFKDASFEVGLDGTSVAPYVKVGDKVYSSTNKFYTSDAWATNSSGTSGDNWFSKLTQCNISISYDGSMFRVYRNGLLDINAEVGNLSATNLTLGDQNIVANIASAAAYKECLTNEQIKAAIVANAMAAVTIPEVTVTDIVLPERVAGTAVAWTSSHPQIISATGIFRAPEADTDVELTASFLGQELKYATKACSRDINNNILAIYKFEAEDYSSDSKTVYDHSGNNNALVVVGANALVDGTLNLSANQGTAFDTNAYGLVPACVMDGLRSFSVLVEATPVNLTKQPRLFDFGFSSGNSVFLRGSALSAGVKYSGGTTTMVNASTQLKAGEMNRVAVTYDAGTHLTCIYLNGELVGSGTQNVIEPYQISAAQMCDRNYIGRTQWWDTSSKGDNLDYCGTIDNFYMFNTALTLDEIRQLQGYQEINPDLDIDCTEAVANPGFEEAYSVMSNSGVTSDRAIYVPNGWTIDYTDRNENDMTVIGKSDLYASMFSSIPTTNQGGKNAYLVRQKWGTSTISLSQVCDALAPAYYRLSAEAWQSGLGGNASIWAKAEGIDKVSAMAPSNVEEWQNISVEFTCNGKEKVSIGLTALHNENGSEKYLGFDNFKLEDITANCTEPQIAALIARMIPAAEAMLNGPLSESTKSLLSEACDKAKQVGASSSYDDLMDAYRQLREAMTTAGLDHISSVEIDADSLPVYDLSGRRVLDFGTDEAIRSLAPGFYIHGATKVIVR